MLRGSFSGQPIIDHYLSRKTITDCRFSFLWRFFIVWKILNPKSISETYVRTLRFFNRKTCIKHIWHQELILFVFGKSEMGYENIDRTIAISVLCLKQGFSDWHRGILYSWYWLLLFFFENKKPRRVFTLHGRRFTIRCGCPNYFQISLENTIILGYNITAVRVIRW